MQITIDLPDDCKIRHIVEAQGEIFDASTNYVDFEDLYEGRPGAISPTGLILIDIAHQLRKAAYA